MNGNYYLIDMNKRKVKKKLKMALKRMHERGILDKTIISIRRLNLSLIFKKVEEINPFFMEFEYGKEITISYSWIGEWGEIECEYLPLYQSKEYLKKPKIRRVNRKYLKIPIFYV